MSSSTRRGELGCAIAAIRGGLTVRRIPTQTAGAPVTADASGWWPRSCLSLVSIIWGGSFIAARIALREMSPVTLSTVRFALTGGFFFALLLVMPQVSGSRAPAPAHELLRSPGRHLLLYLPVQWRGQNVRLAVGDRRNPQPSRCRRALSPGSEGAAGRFAGRRHCRWRRQGP